MNEMPDLPEIFIDGLGGVAFMGGLIRAEMIKFIPDPAQPNKPNVKVTHRLILSPQAFLQATNVMNELVTKLKDAGVLQPVSQEAAEAAKAKKKS